MQNALCVYGVENCSRKLEIKTQKRIINVIFDFDLLRFFT